jgi:hypothetical protein
LLAKSQSICRIIGHYPAPVAGKIVKSRSGAQADDLFQKGKKETDYVVRSGAQVEGNGSQQEDKINPVCR